MQKKIQVSWLVGFLPEEEHTDCSLAWTHYMTTNVENHQNHADGDCLVGFLPREEHTESTLRAHFKHTESTCDTNNKLMTRNCSVPFNNEERLKVLCPVPLTSSIVRKMF